MPKTEKLEYALIDVGEDGYHNTLYIQRTWETRAEANCIKTELLKGFPTDSPWFKRLQIKKREAIKPSKRNYD